MRPWAYLALALTPALAGIEVTTTYSTTYNLRDSKAVILSRHASLQEATDAAKAKGVGTYSITQPTATVKITNVPDPPCVYEYGVWSACTAGKQIRSISKVSPTVCTPTATILEQACSMYVLTASPETIAPGAASTLAWSGGTAPCTLSASGKTLGVATSGSLSTGPLQATTTVKLTCAGVDRSVTVTVATPPPPPPPKVTELPTCIGAPIFVVNAYTWGRTVTAVNCKV